MDIEQIRKDFEAHNEAWIQLYAGNNRCEDGAYASTALQLSWLSWQAAHAQYTKPAAPVVWPEPIAHMNVSRGGFIATLQDEGPYVFPVYSQAQVRAMLEAQGVKCG